MSTILRSLIVKQTSSKLTLWRSNKLSKTTWKVLLAILVVFPLAIGILVILLSKQVVLSCSRIEANKVNCILINSTSFGLLKAREVSLSQLQGVRIDTKYIASSADHFGSHLVPVYQIVLLSSNGAYPYSDYRDNYQQQQVITSKINNFLHNFEQPSLVIQQEYPTQMIILSLCLMTLITVVSLKTLSVRQKKYIFDKTRGKLTVKAWNLFGFQTTEYELRDCSVRFEEDTDSECCRLVLLLSGDRQIMYKLCSIDQCQELLYIANCIRKFLGLPQIADNSTLAR